MDNFRERTLEILDLAAQNIVSARKAIASSSIKDAQARFATLLARTDGLLDSFRTIAENRPQLQFAARRFLDVTERLERMARKLASYGYLENVARSARTKAKIDSFHQELDQINSDVAAFGAIDLVMRPAPTADEVPSWATSTAGDGATSAQHVISRSTTPDEQLQHLKEWMSEPSAASPLPTSFPPVVSNSRRPQLQTHSHIQDHFAGIPAASEHSSRPDAQPGVYPPVDFSDYPSSLTPLGWSATAIPEHTGPGDALAAGPRVSVGEGELPASDLAAPWCLRATDVRIFRDRVLGEGGFGTVYEGVCDKVPVAVKVLQPLQNGMAREEFMTEARTWYNLNMIAHVLRFQGAYDGNDPAHPEPFIATQLMRSGDIRSYTSTHPEASKMLLLKQAASAVYALHKRGVLHTDIKPTNVLVGDGGAYLADFGFATTKARAAEDGDRPGTSAYQSPERLRWGGVSEEDDVYAFGTTMFEVVLGRRPNYLLAPGEPPVEAPDGSTTRGERRRFFDSVGLGQLVPERARDLRPAGLRFLVRRCWSTEPRDRPTFGHIVDTLRDLVEEEEEEEEAAQGRARPA